MHSRGRLGRAIGATCATVLLAGCGSSGGTGDALLGDGRATFADRRITWAQDSTLHYGGDTFDLSPWVVRTSVPTPYGWMVEVARTQDGAAERSWRFFDGSELHDLPGDLDHVRVSPDGRYVGWVDCRGPLRPAGRIRKIVVVDLRSGEVVLENHDDMGGRAGDDLEARYGELPPTFLGFDADYAYWTNATGHGERRRARIGTWEVSAAAEPDPEAPNAEVGLPVDRYAGSVVGVDEGGRVDWAGRGGLLGTLSPDRSHVAVVGRNSRVLLHRTADGRRVPLSTGHRFAWFGGWLGDGERDTAVYLLTRDRWEGGWDPTKPDRTRGWLTRCDLDTGRCRDVTAVTATRRVHLPGDHLSDRGVG